MYFEGIDFEIVEDFIWFHNDDLLLEAVDNDYLLKEYKDEFIEDKMNKEELLKAIARYIIREGIVINKKYLKNEDCLLFS